MTEKIALRSVLDMKNLSCSFALLFHTFSYYFNLFYIFSWYSCIKNCSWSNLHGWETKVKFFANPDHCKLGTEWLQPTRTVAISQTPRMAGEFGLDSVACAIEVKDTNSTFVAISCVVTKYSIEKGKSNHGPIFYGKTHCAIVIVGVVPQWHCAFENVCHWTTKFQCSSTFMLTTQALFFVLKCFKFRFI